MDAIPHAEALLRRLRALHDTIRVEVLRAARARAVEALAAVADDADAEGDTIFAIDRVSEASLLSGVARGIASDWPLLLIAEGLPDSGLGAGRAMLPPGAPRERAVITLLMDPLDGTRELMYQKRSAWILSGIAPGGRAATRLRDITLAVQTEIPTNKHYLADQLWARRGAGFGGERLNLLTGERAALALRPSRATSIAQGFASISRFFPGGRDALAAVDDALARQVLGPIQRGKAQCFEDQYLSTGGQLYELIAGHDRFVADLRPLLAPLLARRGQALGICAHPYDLATALIAEEAGVLLTDARGAPLDAPLDVGGDVAWVGYANAAIRAEVEPALAAALAAQGML